MRIISGGDTGLIKVIDPQKQKVLFQMGEQSNGRGVEFLKWADKSQESEIVASYKTGEVEFYFPGTGQRRFALLRPQNVATQGLFSENRDNNRNLITCSDKGLVEMFSFKLNNLEAKEEENQENDEDEDEPKQKDIVTITPKVTSFSVGNGNISTMEVVKLGGNKMEIAVAGKDNLMKIFDIETQKCVFKAKNVPKDHLNLNAPIWDNGIVFLGDVAQNNANLVCTRTAYHQVRFFDRRVKRAPITQKSIGDNAFTALIASPKKEKEVVVGTGIGKMYRYNFEKLDAKTLKTYRMMSGSVRDIQAHPSGDYLVTASTDRYVRVYDFDGARLLHSMYLVQRQNCVLVSQEGLTEGTDEDEEEKDDKEEDDEPSDIEDDIEDPKNGVWQNMKKVLHDDGADSDDSIGDDSEDDEEDDDDDSDDDDDDDKPVMKRTLITRNTKQEKKQTPQKKQQPQNKPKSKFTPPNKKQRK